MNMNDESQLEEWEKPPQPLAETTAPKTVSDVVNEKEQSLLKTDEVNKAANLVSEEKIKSELAEKAAEIKAKNIKTAETEFKTETDALRLKHAKAKLKTEHEYDMSIIKEDGIHRAMLNKRKKLEEKYGYLYDKDKDGNIIDFSYSPTVNKLRSLARNFSKLDKNYKQILKIGFFIVVGIGIIFLLKLINVL